MNENTPKLPLAELNGQLPALIAGHRSFEVWDVDMEALFDTVQAVETEIEKQRLTCRIYTRGRLAAAAVGIFHAGAGIATAVGIAAHNIATYNPDYEICKDLANNRLIVEFKK